MLAYAANRPVAGKSQSSPNALLVVISVHVALLAIVMSAKMDLPRIVSRPPIDIFWVPPPKAPVPLPPPRPAPHPRTQTLDQPPVHVPLPPQTQPTLDPGPTTTIDPGPIAGAGTNTITEVPRPVLTPIRHDPRLLTPLSELKPPYPASKLLTEEEATLRLRLTIDEHGRVTAVDPVGRADGVFLQAAQRYLIAHWRYQPATEDGRAVASSTVITLRFQLDG